MSEKLISADRVLFFIKRDSDLLASCGEEQTADDVIAIIKTAPAVDAVEVVRCSQCLLWERARGQRGWCNALIQHHDAERPMTYEYHFCRYGERRDDNAVD